METPDLQSLKHLLNHCPTGIMLLDAGDNVLWHNLAAVTLLGAPADPETSLPGLLAMAQDGALHIERVALGGDTFACYLRPMVPGHVADSSDPEAADNGQGFTHPLTRVLNHRGLMVALEPQVARCRRYREPLSLLALELPAGVNADVSQLLRDQVRWADMIGCTGPNTFVIALPETTATDAVLLAGKLMQGLEGQAGGLRWGTSEWQLGDDAAALIQRAVQNIAAPPGADLPSRASA